MLARRTLGKCVGFTLIELMVTVVLVAIVLTIAVPGFQDVIRNNRMATMANEFVGALNLARSEAIKRGRRVTLCKSADAATAAAPSCAGGGGYHQGWVVFVDANNNGQRDGGEQIIRAYAGLAGAATLTGTAANGVDNYLSYTPLGLNRTASGTPTGGALQLGTLTLCEPYSRKARALALNSLGRIGLTETTC